MLKAELRLNSSHIISVVLSREQSFPVVDVVDFSQMIPHPPTADAQLDKLPFQSNGIGSNGR